MIHSVDSGDERWIDVESWLETHSIGQAAYGGDRVYFADHGMPGDLPRENALQPLVLAPAAMAASLSPVSDSRHWRLIELGKDIRRCQQYRSDAG